jgi:hypothetical protein
MDGPNPGFFKRDPFRQGLTPTLVLALAIAAMAFDLGARAVAADNFKLLGKKEIRATVAGKDITDGAHGSFCLRPDGALVGVESGARWTGAWNVQKSKLCMSNPGSKAFDCYDVWMSGENISLRLKPDDVTFAGVVEKHQNELNIISTNETGQQARKRRR